MAMTYDIASAHELRLLSNVECVWRGASDFSCLLWLSNGISFYNKLCGPVVFCFCGASILLYFFSLSDDILLLKSQPSIALTLKCISF